MSAKALLNTANNIWKQNKCSDQSYNDIFALFSAPSATTVEKDNAKAILKKDLALISIISDILTLFSILATIGIIGTDWINSIFTVVVVLIYSLLYLFKLKPAIEKETYVLSIIEDI